MPHTPGRETCPACGAEFGCSAAQPGCPCWCVGVDVPERALLDLAQVHDGCLCPTCLARIAAAATNVT
ncbi:MAG TPA: cysteine-rich CWC family protein [Ilumatobacter sp.]|nr:cysteine-rich CWC family protein [Ilumatobacter sp.]